MLLHLDLALSQCSPLYAASLLYELPHWTIVRYNTDGFTLLFATPCQLLSTASFSTTVGLTLFSVRFSATLGYCCCSSFTAFFTSTTPKIAVLLPWFTTSTA